MRELRKLDPSTLKFGDMVLTPGKNLARFIVSRNQISNVLPIDQNYVCDVMSLFEPPLAWVEDQPVYIGDTLYTKTGELVFVTLPSEYASNESVSEFFAGLTWGKPKTKHRVWIVLYADGSYGTYDDKARAERIHGGRSECRLIEWAS